MSIMFYFNYKWTVLPLPVNPQSIEVRTAGTNKTMEIVKLGEINILRDVKLAELTIESFFPATADGPWVLTKTVFVKPQVYKALFEELRKNKKPCRLVVSEIGINMEVSVESFQWSMEAGDPDMHYKLQLKEYKPHAIKTVAPKKNDLANTLNMAKKVLSVVTGISSGGNTARQKTGFAIGDTVIVDGRYWYDSYGASPYGTFKNFTGKISKIVADKKRKCRYHITTPSGDWRGWVNESQMKHP